MCSLNLVCYRSGAQGCQIRQIQTLNRSRFNDEKELEKILDEQPDIISTDVELFTALRREYLERMCGFWRRATSMKTLSGFRLLQFAADSRPTAVSLDEFELLELLYAFNNPSEIDGKGEWIEWVFNLRGSDQRYALEFVEGWNTTRIAIACAIPLVTSTVVGTVWSARTGDVQTAFTVAGFILTSGTLILAMVAIASSVDSK